MARSRSRFALLLATVLAASLAPAADATDSQPATDPPAAPVPASMARPAGTTTLVSAEPGGTPGNALSLQAAMAAGGRYVAFTSAASDLTADDGNAAAEVFVRDRQTGAIDRAVPFDSTSGGTASEPSISADGMVVAFRYDPPLAATISLGPRRVIIWDRRAGTFTTITSGGPTSIVAARDPAVSADGTVVAFVTDTPIDPTEHNEWEDVYLYDRASGSLRWVSIDADNDSSFSPAVSRNGQFVAFASDGIDPAFGLGFGTQVYVRDMAAGRTELVSVGTDDRPGRLASDKPSISDDGSRIAFESNDSGLVGGDTNGTTDVFVRDRGAGGTSIVSGFADGSPVAAPSFDASITGDGRMVAFACAATLVEAAVPVTAHLAATGILRSEVFLRDTVTGGLVLISAQADGLPAGAGNDAPSVGGNGRFVAFSSTSPALASGDDNKVSDVFLRDLPPVPAVAPNPMNFGTLALGEISPPSNATVSNGGWGPLVISGAGTTGGAAGDYEVTLGGCAGATLHSGESCIMGVVFFPVTEGARNANLRIDDDFEGPPATTRLRGSAGPPKERAKLTVEPASGPPGMVVVATGSGFPVGADVALTWSRGISPTLGPIKVKDDGTFRVQVLVFHHDQTGDRNLVAVPAGPTLFSIETAPYRVVEPHGQPPSFVLVPSGDERTPAIIIRR